MDARWLVTPKEGDRYPLGPPVSFPLVVKWYNVRLISGYHKFNSCREDQVLGFIQQIKIFSMDEKKLILLFFGACSLQRTVNPLPLIGGWLADGSIPSGSTSCQHI